MGGVIARDMDGRVLVAESINQKEVPSSFATEALACRQTVHLGVEQGCTEVEIEGDSLSIIKKCQSKFRDKTQIETYIQDI